MWKKIKGNNMDVKIIFICLFIIGLSFSYAFLKNNDYVDTSNLDKSIYNYDAKSIDGELIKMSDYKGKKLIIVNVASKCGFTYQYEGLQSLYEQYKGKVEILAFPSNDFLWQEPGKNAAIKTNSIVLFKGNDTVISNYKGETYVNYLSSPYLATAGSGDVLSGIIASFLSQGYESLEAAKTGCFLHSQCAIKINKPLSAKDIINILPTIIKKF